MRGEEPSEVEREESRDDEPDNESIHCAESGPEPFGNRRVGRCGLRLGRLVSTNVVILPSFCPSTVLYCLD